MGAPPAHAVDRQMVLLRLSLRFPPWSIPLRWPRHLWAYRNAEETCQHFAVIDEKIVWYGSMNLLSRDDVEDNIMRLESREVAEELLGIVHFCE